MKRLEHFMLRCLGIFFLWCLYSSIQYAWVNEFTDSAPPFNFFELIGTLILLVLRFISYGSSFLLAIFTLWMLFFDDSSEEKYQENENELITPRPLPSDEGELAEKPTPKNGDGGDGIRRQ